MGLHGVEVQTRLKWSLSVGASVCRSVCDLFREPNWERFQPSPFGECCAWAWRGASTSPFGDPRARTSSAEALSIDTKIQTFRMKFVAPLAVFTPRTNQSMQCSAS